VLVSVERTDDALAPGFRQNRTDATPATCGVAIDVPEAVK
jgi:hypothetical protein